MDSRPRMKSCCFRNQWTVSLLVEMTTLHITSGAKMSTQKTMQEGRGALNMKIQNYFNFQKQ